MTRLTGGRTLYGHALGVLMLDTVFPRIPGDVGNALTWPFPVLYRVALKGAGGARAVAHPDGELLDAFIAAARELEAQGVRAITTSCGYLCLFQREMAAAVSVPMVTSSLLQVPLVARLIRPDQRVGILTERPHLTEAHFNAAGWSSADIRVVVMTLPPGAVFPTVFIDGAPEADLETLECEMAEAGERMRREHPDVGAIVLECTNFVPFSQTIRRATGLPVYDLYTLVMQAYQAIVGTTFPRP